MSIVDFVCQNNQYNLSEYWHIARAHINLRSSYKRRYVSRFTGWYAPKDHKMEVK